MSSSPRNFRVELLAIAAVTIGILLLGDFGPVRAALQSALLSFIGRFSTTALLGLALLGGGLLFLSYRVRVHFLRSARWHATACPRCGSKLHMIHRHWYDRVLSKTVLPHARRYRCSNATCRWSGLLHVAHRHSEN